MFVSVFISFIREEKHLQIGFDAQEFPEIRQIVKEVRAPARYVYGDDITFA
jgi:hypothetical protein